MNSLCDKFCDISISNKNTLSSDVQLLANQINSIDLENKHNIKKCLNNQCGNSCSKFSDFCELHKSKKIDWNNVKKLEDNMDINMSCEYKSYDTHKNLINNSLGEDIQCSKTVINIPLGEDFQSSKNVIFHPRQLKFKPNASYKRRCYAY